MLETDAQGSPYTPRPTCFNGLGEAVRCCSRRLDNVFARHKRLAAATRAASHALGLELSPGAEGLFAGATAAVMPPAMTPTSSQIVARQIQHEALLRAAHADIRASTRHGDNRRNRGKRWCRHQQRGMANAVHRGTDLADPTGGAGRGLVCTTITALMVCALSCASLASISAGSTARRQSPGMKSTSMPSAPHLAPQRGKVAGLHHQHRVAWRQRVDDRGFPGPGPRRWKMMTGPLVLKMAWLPLITA